MILVEDEKSWYIEVENKQHGPYSIQQIRSGLEQKKIFPETLVYGPGLTKWEPLFWHPDLMGNMFSKKEPPPMPKTTFHRSQLAHEIDFEIHGEEMQFVEIELDPGEAAVSEAGSMMFMDDAIQMETVLGTGEEDSGLMGKLVGAGKRLITGESLFMTVFTNQGVDKHRVSFAAPYPGKILPINLAEMGQELICQKDSFLCAAKGVSIDIAFQKRIGVGLFGGEGFIMQRLKGDGLAFIHAGGTLIHRKLTPGEALKVDTGCLVALEPSVHYDIQYVGGIKSAIFGGEGFFFAYLKGPGSIWLQSLPFSRLAGRIHNAAPGTGAKAVGEDSLIGGINRIFER